MDTREDEIERVISFLQEVTRKVTTDNNQVADDLDSIAQFLNKVLLEAKKDSERLNTVEQKLLKIFRELP